MYRLFWAKSLRLMNAVSISTKSSALKKSLAPANLVLRTERRRMSFVLSCRFPAGAVLNWQQGLPLGFHLKTSLNQFLRTTVQHMHVIPEFRARTGNIGRI